MPIRGYSSDPRKGTVIAFVNTELKQKVFLIQFALPHPRGREGGVCLLYTSDAADEDISV